MARRSLTDRFGAALGTELLERARLLTSELVTNALVHGRGSIELHAQLNDARLRVEVIDEGTPFVPPGPVSGVGTIGGLGLVIVDLEASRWGIGEGTTHVWFEIERPGPRV